MTRIKICGITAIADALAACEAGADRIGLVFAPSRRRVTPETAREIVRSLPPSAISVGVFMDQSAREVSEVAEKTRIDEVQLHGHESAADFANISRAVIKRIDVDAIGSPLSLLPQIEGWMGCLAAILLDPGAGDGRPFEWNTVRGRLPKLPTFISGGLTPDNVGECVRLLRPYAVDICSGVERSPGIKDHARMRDFIQAVREADADVT